MATPPTRARRPAFAAAVVAVVVGLGATPAGADEVTVRNIDTREYPSVRLEVLVEGATPKTTDFHLRENGAVVPDAKIEVRPLKQTASPVGTVLVIDTSGSMQSRGAIEQAKAAARQFIAAKAPNDWIGLVSFSSQAVIGSDFTQDGDTLTAAIDGLEAAGDTALWDGLSTAARLYERRPDLQANVLLLSDGADTVSSGTEGEAVAALTGAHAAVFAVGIASDEFDPGGLARTIAAAGGSLSTSSDPNDLTAQFARIRAAIENQYEVRYTSSGSGGPLSLDLTVGELVTQVQARAGSVGPAASPRVVGASGGLLATAGAKYLVLLLAAIAAGLGAWALLVLFTRREQSVDARLGIYASPQGLDESPEGAALAETGIVQRAVELTSLVAGRSDLLLKVEVLLEQANLPLRPAEALFFYGAGVGLLGAMAVLAAPTLPVGLAAAGLVAALPLMGVRVQRRRRLKQFEAQLPDTLNLLSGSLRAGYSFLQCVEAVAQETSDPMARELRRVLAEARLGRPVEVALGDVATRMQSSDFEWAVMAIGIQREVGGNLAELLQTVADTMVQRSRLKGEVKALTAEGRMSGVIMGLLPLGLGLFMFTAAPDYIGELFNSVMGWAMVGGSVLMGLAGFAWIQKIITIKA